MKRPAVRYTHEIRCRGTRRDEKELGNLARKWNMTLSEVLRRLIREAAEKEGVSVAA